MGLPTTVDRARAVLAADASRETETETPPAFDRDVERFAALAPGCYQRKPLPAAE